MVNAALDLGDQLAELGVEYTEQEITELLAEDPIRVMNFLQDKLAKVKEEGGGGGAGDQDLDAAIEAGIEKRLGPIQERENIRMTNEANALFERTAHSELTAIFKEEGVNLADVPGEELFPIITAASELFKYNVDDIHALKHEGKTAPIQKAVRDAKAFMDKYFMARATRERGAVAGGRGAGRGAGAGAGAGNGQLEPGFVRGADGKPRRATLDELAEAPEIIGSKYK